MIVPIHCRSCGTAGALAIGGGLPRPSGGFQMSIARVVRCSTCNGVACAGRRDVAA